MQKIQTLSEVIKHVYREYKEELTEFGLAIWLKALQFEDLNVVKRAFLNYMTGPNGNFAPKAPSIILLVNAYKAAEAEAKRRIAKKYHDDTELMQKYEDAMKMAASTDKNVSILGWKEIATLRILMAQDFLRFKNGWNYRPPVSSSDQPGYKRAA